MLGNHSFAIKQIRHETSTMMLYKVCILRIIFAGRSIKNENNSATLQLKNRIYNTMIHEVLIVG